MKWEDEAHYYHTIQYFVALMRQYGTKQVLEDVKVVDLDTYNDLCYNVLQAETKKKATAAIFKPFTQEYDADGRC